MKNTQNPTHNQFDKKSEAWSARFSEPVSDLVKRYTASVDFDKRLALVDIQGSLAHATMLAAVKVITAQDLADIERGMAQILTRCNWFQASLKATNRGNDRRHFGGQPDRFLKIRFRRIVFRDGIVDT